MRVPFPAARITTQQKVVRWGGEGIGSLEIRLVIDVKSVAENLKADQGYMNRSTRSRGCERPAVKPEGLQNIAGGKAPAIFAGDAAGLSPP